MLVPEMCIETCVETCVVMCIAKASPRVGQNRPIQTVSAKICLSFSTISNICKKQNDFKTFCDLFLLMSFIDKESTEEQSNGCPLMVKEVALEEHLKKR